jgi:hypothetical protein
VSGRGRYPLLSLLLLLPVFWQPRLQAGDLSSHIYNAWLAQLIESGRAEGLTIVRQWTNVLFDLMLSGLFRAFGPEAAQRIAVAIAVLTFAWGAFAFVGAVAGRRPWGLLPCIVMLAYGWVFHMGFFNFYLSMGLCFWAMALLWEATPRRIAVAAGLLALSCLAHALPVLWAVSLSGYVALARRVSPSVRARLTVAVVLAMIAAQVAARVFFIARWSHTQWTLSTGADQLWVFGTKYYIPLAGLLLVEGLLFLRLLRDKGKKAVVGSVPFHLVVIAAAAVFVLPGAVLPPGFSHTLTFIAERLSLGVAICVCALLGSVETRKIESAALLGIAFVFFGFLYADERALNAFEDRMQEAISTLPPGQRVVNIIGDYSLRTNPVGHMIDRVCVGRCYSYANYEPSTGQFRVRAVARNPIVTPNYGESFYLQIGERVIQDSELPMYAVDIEPSGRMFVRPLRSGMKTGAKNWDTLDDRPRP